jgi:hypothetical protein
MIKINSFEKFRTKSFIFKNCFYEYIVVFSEFSNSHVVPPTPMWSLVFFVGIECSSWRLSNNIISSLFGNNSNHEDKIGSNFSNWRSSTILGCQNDEMVSFGSKSIIFKPWVFKANCIFLILNKTHESCLGFGVRTLDRLNFEVLN